MNVGFGSKRKTTFKTSDHNGFFNHRNRHTFLCPTPNESILCSRGGQTVLSFALVLRLQRGRDQRLTMTIKTTNQEPAGNDATLSELIQLALEHVDFLRKLHYMGITLKKPCSESFRRYKDLWLPLVAKSYDSERIVRNQLAPPPDIAWLWHCHRLAPAKYEEYIRQQFGSSAENKTNKTESILDLCDPQAPFEMTIPGAFELYARDVWKESYPSEPFFLPQQDQSAVGETMAPPYLGGLCGFDLIGSTTRQATFLWQISGPDFFYAGKDTFKFEVLEQGVQNYNSFFKLKRQRGAKKQMLVPTFQIDLIWHTHILSSIKKYNEDCIRILGSKFDHDDSFLDRTHGGTLDVAYKATSKLWKKAYGTEYDQSGASYRGEPPERYFQSAWTSADDIVAYAAVSPQTTTTAPQAVTTQDVAVVTEEVTDEDPSKTMRKRASALPAELISLMIEIVCAICCGAGRGTSGGDCDSGGGCGGGGCGGGGCGGED
jgi:hypothetical protein